MIGAILRRLGLTSPEPVTKSTTLPAAPESVFGTADTPPEAPLPIRVRFVWSAEEHGRIKKGLRIDLLAGHLVLDAHGEIVERVIPGDPHSISWGGPWCESPEDALKASLELNRRSTEFFDVERREQLDLQLSQLRAARQRIERALAGDFDREDKGR